MKQPHVAQYWQETDDEIKFRHKFLVELQQRGVCPYIIFLSNRPIGFIQSYEACKVGGGWWPNEEPGVFGIDQFIGEPDLVGKGYGTQLIQAFVDRLWTDPKVRQIITDPDPKNGRAIRAYEKVGFIKEQEITTPGGPAILLRLNRGR